jgi:hypothetical protein
MMSVSPSCQTASHLPHHHPSQISQLGQEEQQEAVLTMLHRETSTLLILKLSQVLAAEEVKKTRSSTGEAVKRMRNMTSSGAPLPSCCQR